jgi:hypothetical protein
MMEKHGFTLRLYSVMGAVTMLTFGTLVEAYRLLF